MPRSAAPRAWQRMLSGRRLDLLDPSPLDIEIEDIAHGLARVARWNGQTHGEHIFSVAQHTLLAEEIARRVTGAVDRRLALALLLHDAPEYVIGDMISPFKAVMGGAYKAVERRLLTPSTFASGCRRSCRPKSSPSSRRRTAAPRFWRRPRWRDSPRPKRAVFRAPAGLAGGVRKRLSDPVAGRDGESPVFATVRSGVTAVSHNTPPGHATIIQERCRTGSMFLQAEAPTPTPCPGSWISAAT